MLEACIIPILTYGAQTWSLTQAQARKLVTAQRAFERSLLNIRKNEKIKSSWIRSKTKCKGVVYTIKKLKMKYAGHVARLENERWCRRATFWVPYELAPGEGRSVGRPATRWRDEITKRVGLPWCRAAQNRRVWTKIGEAYAHDVGAWYDAG